MFQGGEYRVDAKDFRGGAVSTMFGGYEVDLRQAAMAEGQATIDVNVMFGGVEIQIPPNWAADVRGMGLFGAFVDETQHPAADAAANPPRLIVTGYAMFGGVTVAN
jgi:predicted membrane protein